MHPVPQPHVLDPDRSLDNDRGDFTIDHQTRAALIDDALHTSCRYGQQLWNTLAAVRQYLFDSLPPDPRTPGPHPHVSASPTGPDDETGWNNWITAYSSVTAVLCGPQGDSGYGLHEARSAAQQRRNAPNLSLYAAHPDLGDASVKRHSDTSPTSAPPTEPTAAPVNSPLRRSARAAATAVLILLAVRGMRPRHYRRP